MILDFQQPVAQISAMVSHFLALKLILLITSSSASGYLKQTFLNSTSHLTLVSSVISQSLIRLSVFNTSAILFADTAAHGIITRTNTNITKEIINCDAYDEKTIISENNPNLSQSAACEIMIPHKKYTAKVNIFIITSTDGMSTDNALEANRFVFISFSFASLNFFS
jgi:hypothetical protein